MELLLFHILALAAGEVFITFLTGVALGTFILVLNGGNLSIYWHPFLFNVQTINTNKDAWDAAGCTFRPVASFVARRSRRGLQCGGPVRHDISPHFNCKIEPH